MSMRLFDSTVAAYLQTLGALEAVLARGLEHCRAHQLEAQELVEATLYHDMLPFRFQVLSTITHSVEALEAVRRGHFSPPTTHPQLDYAGLQSAVAEARESLSRQTPEEIEALIGRDVTFEFRGRAVPFTAENFLLSFSIPNFYFHASTTYGILRSRGVPLGKRDFMGQLRIKR